MSTRNHARERGLSLVELMIGIALSLFIIAGALKVFAGHLESSRHSLIGARLDQEIRMASNLIARELQRAGYSRATEAGIASLKSNVNGEIATLGTASAALVSYRYDGNPDAASDASILLRDGVLKLKTGPGGAQPITDADTINVTKFTVAPHVTTASLGHLCVPVCSIDEPKCPRVQTRFYDITIAAQSTLDAHLTREIRESVRVRNDELAQRTCP